MPTKQKPEAPAPEQQAAYTIKKRHGYRGLVGDRSQRRAGVPDRLQARRGGGGAAADGVTGRRRTAAAGE
jgi:hypothetical protein